MLKHDHLHSLPTMDTYPQEIVETANYAATAHETQTRKLSGVPYIVHPVEAMDIARTVTDHVPTLQAVVLHDTVEDTWVTFEDLRRKFGAEVAEIVRGVTKDETIEGWRARNEDYLNWLRNEAPVESVTVALADKIHNLTDMLDNYAKLGDAMWEEFSAEPREQLWWYTSVLAIGRERLPDSPLNDWLESLIDRFRAQVVGSYARRAAAMGA